MRIYAKTLFSQASIKSVNLAQSKKGADQLCDYHVADLCLCFSHIQNNVFLSFGSFQVYLLSTNKGADLYRKQKS